MRSSKKIPYLHRGLILVLRLLTAQLNASLSSRLHVPLRCLRESVSGRGKQPRPCKRSTLAAPLIPLTNNPRRRRRKDSPRRREAESQPEWLSKTQTATTHAHTKSKKHRAAAGDSFKVLLLYFCFVLFWLTGASICRRVCDATIWRHPCLRILSRSPKPAPLGEQYTCCGPRAAQATSHDGRGDYCHSGRTRSAA